MAAIYLVRHGESETNVRMLLSHRKADLPLTARGLQQAGSVARRLAPHGLARVYSSPLLRAHQTAACIAELTGAPLVLDDALREIDCGILDGRGDVEAWANTREIDRRWDDGEWDARFPGGESYRELYDRLAGFLNAVMRDHPGEDVAVVGHGGLFGFVVPRLCALPGRAPSESWISPAAVLHNTSVTVLRHHESTLACDLWGCVEHLPDL